MRVRECTGHGGGNANAGSLIATECGRRVVIGRFRLGSASPAAQLGSPSLLRRHRDHSAAGLRADFTIGQAIAAPAIQPASRPCVISDTDVTVPAHQNLGTASPVAERLLRAVRTSKP